jgi:hypothetical protein
MYTSMISDIKKSLIVAWQTIYTCSCAPYFGIMFDKSISVYEAIEKLQGGSVMGFQFQVQGNLFTARLDDPDRKKRKEVISYLEIININEVEVDWNADLYGTFTNIEYAQNYSEKKYQAWVDRAKQQKILAIHRVNKEWNVKTLLAKEDYADEVAKNEWLDAVNTVAELRKTGLSNKKNYLCKVVADPVQSGTYQAVEGWETEPVWRLFNSSVDLVNEQELTKAVGDHNTNSQAHNVSLTEAVDDPDLTTPNVSGPVASVLQTMKCMKNHIYKIFPKKVLIFIIRYDIIVKCYFIILKRKEMN